MNITRTDRSGSSFTLTVLLGLMHAGLGPAASEAQILDRLQGQAPEARQQVEELPPQIGISPPEDGRFVASLTSGAGEIHRLEGEALLAHVLPAPRAREFAVFRLVLCGAARLGARRPSGTGVETEYLIGADGPPQTQDHPKTAHLTFLVPNPWTGEALPQDRFRGYLTIKEATGDVVVGTLRGGSQDAQFEAAFRATRSSRAIHPLMRDLPRCPQ